jgi:hypothetical protein
MSIAAEQPTKTIVIEMNDGPVVANELAPLAWIDLREYLRTAYHALCMERSFRGMHIGLNDVLSMEVPISGQVDILLLCVGPVRAYGIHATFDRDLRYLHYTVSGDPIARDLFAVSEADSGDYGFRTREGVFMSVDEVGRSMLATLTACK